MADTGGGRVGGRGSPGAFGASAGGERIRLPAGQKNDVRDAADVCDLLRMGRLPEAYIATPAELELRELVRHRAKLRSGFKAQVHGVLAKQGLLPPCSDVFGVTGMAWLRTAPLDLVYRQRVLSLLELIDAYDEEVDLFRVMIAHRFRSHHGYRVSQRISGVGPTFAAISSPRSVTSTGSPGRRS